MTMSGDVYVCHRRGRACSCHLLDRSQGCCCQNGTGQGSPSPNQKRIICPQNVSDTEPEKSCLGVYHSLHLIFSYFLLLLAEVLLLIYDPASVLSPLGSPFSFLQGGPDATPLSSHRQPVIVPVTDSLLSYS